ncbi:MAG: Chain length determinant protein [Mucilaginibacter sp.]|nr:Chain length determinant protein [Mucilaginibacter sp.]
MNQAHSRRAGRNILALLARNKYLTIISVLLFVLAASAYLLFSSAKYKVKVELSLSGSDRSLESTIKELRSKVAVQEALNSLSFQVSYYRKGTFTRTEIYGDSLPIKFILGKGSTYDSPTEININLISSSVCRVDQNNVLTDVPLYHPVKYGSLNYTIVKGPAFKQVQPQLTIKLNLPADLTEQFNKNLDTKVLSGNTFELSLNADNAQKGQEFLNRLIDVVNSRYAKTYLPEKPAVNSSYLKNLNDSIAYYKTIANKYQEQLNVLNHIKKATPNVATEKQKLTLNVLDAIKPYLTKPNNTFVLIPDGYNVNDNHIKKLIQDFNHAQLEKQRQLQDSDVADASVYAFTLEIEPLKNELLNAITRRDEQIRDSSQPKWSKSVGAFVLTQLNDSLAQVNALIINKQKLYKRKVLNIDAGDATPRLTIIQKSDNRESMVPKSLLIYLLALLAGLLLPLLLLTLNKYLSSVKRVVLQHGNH